LHRHISTFIMQIMNKILQGQTIPSQWTEGAIIHIRNKEGEKECINYRPIFLTQIIYKIWPKLQTERMARILHLAPSNTQFGYKSGLSTIDAVIKLERAIQTGPFSAEIALVDLIKAFGSVNRQILWGTLFEIGLPMPLVKHIKEGRQNTTLRCKDNITYGPPITNNVGVFR